MSKLTPPINSRDHVQGNPEAPVSLVEFGDYECSFCGQAHSVIKALQEALGDRLCFVFRNFPLGEVHPHAVLAAQAAELAGAQGKYWELHDLLYEHQDALDLSHLRSYAGLLGLDVALFDRDLRTNRFIDKIRTDLHSGALSGVNGTPTFFINGDRHDGPWDFNALWQALARATGAELIV
jgi:protein-disulfide isomerase